MTCPEQDEDDKAVPERVLFYTVYDLYTAVSKYPAFNYYCEQDEEKIIKGAQQETCY